MKIMKWEDKSRQKRNFKVGTYKTEVDLHYKKPKTSIEQ